MQLFISWYHITKPIQSICKNIISCNFLPKVSQKETFLIFCHNNNRKRDLLIEAISFYAINSLFCIMSYNFSSRWYHIMQLSLSKCFITGNFMVVFMRKVSYHSTFFGFAAKYHNMLLFYDLPNKKFPYMLLLLEFFFFMFYLCFRRSLGALARAPQIYKVL